MQTNISFANIESIVKNVYSHEDGEGDDEDGKSGGAALNPLPDEGGTRAKTTFGNGLEAGI